MIFFVFIFILFVNFVREVRVTFSMLSFVNAVKRRGFLFVLVETEDGVCSKI